jgi:hypothetical protein
MAFRVSLVVISLEKVMLDLFEGIISKICGSLKKGFEWFVLIMAIYILIEELVF